MIESPFEVASGDIRLAGTLCLPAETGRFPAVLMIHGSGPLDRDENMKGQRLDVFNTIAHRLAKDGIASFRYDKRGCGASGGDFLSAGHHDLVEDAVSCIDALADHPSCDRARIFVLGHSEGCLIAPEASLLRPAVAGLILLCPFIEKLEPTLIKQAEQIEREFKELRGIGGFINRTLAGVLGGPLASQKKLIAKLKASPADTIRVGFQKQPAKWFRELFEIDPAEVFAKVTCPMLIIGGEKDVQCDPGDAAKIAAAAKGPCEQHVIKDLTHILRRDKGPASLFGYAALFSQPMDEEVMGLIAAWVGIESLAKAQRRKAGEEDQLR